jgi:restriction system protein
VGERLQALRAMPWEAFSELITGAYRRQGYEVAAMAGTDACDYTLTRGDRVTLLQCRRWKVNQLGVAPLEALARAVDKQEAAHGICITAGVVSPRAADFASANPLTIVSGRTLAELAGRLKKTR